MDYDCVPLEPFAELECFPKGIVTRLVETLRRIAEQQPKTLQTLRDNGCVFTDIGSEPGNWQHAAFTIYTDLCELDLWARAALAAFDEKGNAGIKEGGE